MKPYDPKTIEPKWRKIWEDTKLYQSAEDPKKKKQYILDFFPYPSGAGLSVGHVRNYTISDAYPRFKRMQGYNVLHPMGWDAFGLPSENYAIKNKISPRQATDQNKANYKRQMQMVGLSYDWEREVDSSEPDYYKWTQWFFLLLFKRGLAYQAESEQWWCPVDKTVLANEQVENGKCWRCGNEVTKKSLKQWFFRITEYADRLLEDLDDIDWPEGIKDQQRNWIGKSEGIDIEFPLEKSEKKIVTFTKFPETIFGVTYIVLAPEHELVKELTTKEQRTEVEKYVKTARQETEINRLAADKEKTGVFTGSYAINPVNQKKVPVWVADYVLQHFGTGAVMGVPAHDQRDFVFARKYELPIVRVVGKDKDDDSALSKLEDVIEDGVLVNSGELSGLKAHSPANIETIKWLVKKGYGQATVNYRMRDWLISRQRYWGAPIPIIHCPKDGVVAVPDDQLPVQLPEIKSYEPSGDGKSPLALVPEFVKTKCPKCGGPAERETDTMDGFACSSWYFLRFADPHNDKSAFDKNKIQYWLPIDMYIGGAEHAVMHLLYARFWTKVMQDAGLIDFGEPFKSLRNQGLILAADGRKMSKSLNNVIPPEEVIDKGYGADALRVFELFIAPYDQTTPWDEKGLAGTFRFLGRVWVLFREFKESKPVTPVDNQRVLEAALATTVHKTVKKATEDLEDFGFNTAVAALMELTNNMYKLKEELPFGTATDIWQANLETLLKLLAPFAPHISEELWHELGHEDSVHIQSWPSWDAKLVEDELVTVVVQVNGKVRANITLPPAADEKTTVAQAKQDAKVQSYLKGKRVTKTITVPKKLVNFVVK